MSGKNIGDELNAAHLSWGWFQGGFRPTTSFADAAAATGHTGQPTSTFIPDEFKGKFFQNVPHASDQGICNADTAVGAGLTSPLPTGTGQFGFKDDYIPHHEPFEYYASTANPHHLTVPANVQRPGHARGLRSIGTDTQHFVKGQPQFDTPNHQYDMSDFDQLVAAIHRHVLPASALPAVSFLKAPGFQDGHAAYSDPLDEQQFVVREINALRADGGLAQHRGDRRLRRLRRLVRPCVLRGDQPVHVGRRRAHRHRHVRLGHAAGGPAGPLRLRPAAAAPADLARGPSATRWTAR